MSNATIEAPWSRRALAKLALAIGIGAVAGRSDGGLEGLRRLGRLHLAADPGAADPAWRARWLPDGGDVDRLRAALAEQRRREFAAGDVVIVDGWVLARSEARLAAFVAQT